MNSCRGRREKHFKEIKEEAEEGGLKFGVSMFWPGLCSLCDSVGSSLQIVSILLMPASINQMLSGGTIITTCFLSKFMNNFDICRHHYLGCGLALLGFVCVGVSSLLNGDNVSQYGAGSLITGILMVTGSLFTQGTMSNIEEWILTRWHIDCQRMVGLEGFFGMIWIYCIIIIVSFIPCPNVNMCDMNGYMDDPISGFREIFENTPVLIWTCVIIFAILFFNLNGIVLTKHVSCTFRAFWDATRTVTVWLISASLGLESFSWAGTPVQLAGFILLVVGNLTYNEVIEWKCCGLNKKLKKYDVVVKKRSFKTKSVLDRERAQAEQEDPYLRTPADE